MNFRYLFSFAASALVCSSFDCLAQNTESDEIHRDVDVVNLYQPTLHRARKLSVAPVQDDTMNYKPRFSYETLNRVSTVTTKPDSLSAADMVFPAYDSPYRALVQGAVGNSPTLLGQIFYNIGNSKNYHLSLRAGHLANLGKVKMADDSKVKDPQNDSWVGLNFFSFKDRFRLGIDAKFNNSAYRFYGLNTVVDSVSYFNEDGNVVSGSDFNDVLKQRNTNFDADFSFANSKVDPRDAFTFASRAGFGIFGNKYGVHQFDLRFAGALRFPIRNNAAITADLAVNHFHLHQGDASQVLAFPDRHTTDIDIFPHFLLDYDYMTLQLGLRIFAIIGDNTTKDDFLVQPDLLGKFFIGDGNVHLYVGLTGDYCPNSFRDLIEQNRYLSPDSRMYLWRNKTQSFVLRNEIRASQTPFKFECGVRAKFSQVFQFHIGMDYSSLGDENFFVNRNFYAQADSSCAFSSQFALLQDDGKLFRAHAEFNVSPTDDSNILLSAMYNKYNLDNLQEAWYKPLYELKLSGRFMPVERLQVRASLAYVGERFAYDPSASSRVKLDNFLDLNVGAHYYISNRWTAFLDLNNLTAADQQPWLGYSSYRVNVLAGITYKF